MDEHPENHGSYEYFLVLDLELTIDGENWIDLSALGSFQFGLGKELLAIWSSNNRYNQATGGAAFEIPAGEFRFNRVIPTMNGSVPDYLKMQFFDIYRYNYRSIFGESGTAAGIPGGFSPVVANWLQTTNAGSNSGYGDEAFTGLFTPIINYDGINLGGRRLKKQLLMLFPV